MAVGPKYAEAVTAFNRFGLGARPGDLEAADRDPRGFLLEELSTVNVALIRDSPPPSGLTAFEAYYLGQQQQRVARMKAAATGRQTAVSTGPTAAMARGASSATTTIANASASQTATMAPPSTAVASGISAKATAAKSGVPKPPSAEQVLFRAEADARLRKQLQARVEFVERSSRGAMAVC
jgi:uncharacterized protein (DUF1800 family)